MFKEAIKMKHHADLSQGSRRSGEERGQEQAEKLMTSTETGRKLARRTVSLKLRFNRTKRVISIGLESVGATRKESDEVGRA